MLKKSKCVECGKEIQRYHGNARHEDKLCGSCLEVTIKSSDAELYRVMFEAGKDNHND